MLEEEDCRDGARLIYNGAELYDRLCLHAAEKAKASTCLSTADERMRALAKRIELVDSEKRDVETIYQIAVWALLEHPDYFVNDLCGTSFLAAAAAAGHMPAKFVLAKAIVDGIRWADEEVSYIAKDGNSRKLAAAWLEELSQQGYSDATLEYSYLKWADGERDAAEKIIAGISGPLPEISKKRGVLLLCSDVENALRLIDEGEMMAARCESPLGRLERALEETNYYAK